MTRTAAESLEEVLGLAEAMNAKHEAFVALDPNTLEASRIAQDFCKTKDAAHMKALAFCHTHGSAILSALRAQEAGADYPVYVGGPSAGAFCLHSNCEETIAVLAASYRDDPDDYTATQVDLQYLCNAANDGTHERQVLATPGSESAT